jgi:SAM-dependent methyltransferase
MPDLEWNKSTWDGRYNWSGRGDEWSAPWGTSEAMFFASIMPRIAFAFPAATILEIAPGHGRCTNILLRFVETYVGVDLSETCVNHCRARFANYRNATFHINDGRSLAAVGDATFDFIFSYDSLVHADMDAVGPYIPQIIQRLKPDGAAFIHHSNLGAVPGVEFGFRSTNVSASEVGALIEASGGRVLIQEIFGGNEPGHNSDCFSTFCRSGSRLNAESKLLLSPTLVARENLSARESFVHYMELRG